MAFVSRGMRVTGQLDPTATNENVGPGAYGGHGEYKRDHSYAPFSSTQVGNERFWNRCEQALFWRTLGLL